MVNEYFVNCLICNKKFDLRIAKWCHHNPPTKTCPNGHCICSELPNKEKWRKATPEEEDHGFKIMLKEEFGGKKQRGELESDT